MVGSFPLCKDEGKDEGVLLLLGVKQRFLCLRDHEYCLHHVLYLMQLSVACNLILMGDMLDSDP